MDKTEWPTETRLLELREQGIVPNSNLTTVCAVVAAVLASTYLAGDIYIELWRNYQKAFTLSVHSIDWQALSELVKPLFLALLIPIASASVCAFLVGLFQTKFFVRFSNVSFNLSRLNPFTARSDGERPNLFILAIKEIWIWCAAIALGTLLFLSLARDLAAFLNPKVGFILSTLQTIAGQIVGVVGGILIISAAVIWATNQFFFRLRHRMSKQEIESEAREG